MHSDSKYVVFKRADVEEHGLILMPLAIDDAVVIRLQDKFAPPALDAYANNIQTVIEGYTDLVAGRLLGPAQKEVIAGQVMRLQHIADFFHNAAQESWGMKRKMPD